MLFNLFLVTGSYTGILHIRLLSEFGKQETTAESISYFLMRFNICEVSVFVHLR